MITLSYSKICCMLLAALSTAAAFSTHAESAADAGNAAAEAVKTARETVLPDWKAQLASPSETAAAFGGGDLSLVADQTDLWQSGRGELYGPSVERTVGCRNASDPECLAVQILDKGFPERPVIESDSLSGRDQIIGGLTVPDSGNLACRDFTVTIPPIETKYTCAPGAPFTDLSCSSGWRETVLGISTRWACSIFSERAKSFTCPVVRVPGESEVSHYACHFNSEALAPEREETVITEASASAVFPAVCRAAQKTTVRRTCSKTLSVTAAGGCTPGASASASAEGSPALFADDCAGGDTLTLTHTCAAGEIADRLRIITASINGFGSARLRGTGSAVLRAGACRAEIAVSAHSCTGEGGTACTARVTARIYSGSVSSGTLTAALAYEGWSQGGGFADTWTDGCAGIESDAESGS